MRLLLFALACAASAKSTAKRGQSGADSWKLFRSECERRACRALVPGEDENCILACQAPPCFDLVYGPSPLEPGEIDAQRYMRFQRCLKELQPQLRTASLWPPVYDPYTDALTLPAGGLPGSKEVAPSARADSGTKR
jgi:hypothetical protein